MDNFFKLCKRKNNCSNYVPQNGSMPIQRRPKQSQPFGMVIKLPDITNQ